ncbi:MAG TPA: hypothetical protein VHU19_03485 [Pyrinomonadaceae bacterium]|jgi:hypothetical protein|nr:hypothetical protein [Pyrinomonadaceae bacterium]
MTNGKHLLVPVRVQALVIDELVVERKPILKINEQRRVAGDGKWSRVVQDYKLLINALGSPGPRPFFGATRTAWGQTADQLVLAADSPALPRNEDRGVYLHWVLPPGLRHSYRPNSLDFPALPDQWLIVRFFRRGAEQQRTTKAWFLDGGLVVGKDGPANLLVATGKEYAARRVGRVVPIEEFKPADFAGERTTITAIGNRYTGSPTFTANVAENRNVFSWHDDLGDLREPRGDGKVPKDAALTYLLLGWYHDPQDEPFAALPSQLSKENTNAPPGALDVLKALGWHLDAEPPADLSSHRCLFHGMVAHVNYWNPNTYQGTMLGYPGSPSVEGTLGSEPPAFKVGVGNSAEDALVSLVSSEYSGTKEAPNLWKALEAVIYRQPESLVGSWNAAPRDHTVHQNWFNAQEAGKVWLIRPRPGREGTFPADPAATTAQTAVKPTPEQLAALKRLNELQTAADAASRELSALQQDLYACWWRMCEKTRRDFYADVEDEEKDCEALARRIKTLRAERDALFGQLRAQQAFAAGLPAELELHSDSAPRFWTPADPFVVVKNCGVPTKHHFPNPLPCRLPERIVNAAEVKLGSETKKFSAAADDVARLAASVRKHFAERDPILTSMLEEASVVEQAVSDLVTGSLLTEPRLTSAGKWRAWTQRLIKDLTSDGNPGDLPRDRIRFGKPDALDVRPGLLAELWAQQPWSPLFIDWKITWRPTKNTGPDLGPVWCLDEYDYEPKDRQSLPSGGASVSGRSMLSPVDGRIFDEPLATLRELLKPVPEREKKKGLNPAFPAAVAEILSRYRIVWDKTLDELSRAGMMGQALSGFHQALLRRDVTLPRVTPDPARPWAADDLSFRDSVVEALFDAPGQGEPAAERLAPPSPTDPALDFTLLRAGAFQLEELWLVDDFGQWADLLRGTSAGGSAGQVFHPRARWHDDRFVMAMPPRVVQPARLNFRFTTATDDGPNVGESDPALGSVCGWIFYNALDRALAVCDREGRLVGELVVVEERGRFLVRWEGAPGVGDLERVRNPELRAFAQSLVEPTPTAKPRLHELLALSDRALERIRPAAERRDAVLFGRPLALVSAHVGLELFGKAWTDPHWTDPKKRPAAEPPTGTGDATLDALRVRVLLGCAHNTEDGLVGYFKARDFNRIVPAQILPGLKPSTYLAHPEQDAVRVRFGAAEPLTLLMDAWGSVQAATGLVPAKTITLAHAELDRTLAQMEASFSVGPVLLQPGRIALPTPVSDKGRWHFRGPSTGDAATPVAPSDPRYFDDQPLLAAEGRLLLLTSEE